MEEISNPATSIEEAELLAHLKETGTKEDVLTLRRVLYERDQLRERMERIRTIVERAIDQQSTAQKETSIGDWARKQGY